MSGPAINPSNRPNTIDIELINKNLSEKMNAIKNTGKIENVEIENNQENNSTMLAGKAQEAQIEEMNNKPKKSILSYCKYPLTLLVLYILLHNDYTLDLLKKIKVFENINSPILKKLILGTILVFIYNILKVCY